MVLPRIHSGMHGSVAVKYIFSKFSSVTVVADLIAIQKCRSLIGN